MPALGSKFIDPENVPKIRSGVLIPNPKANKSKKPKTLLPSVATMVKINARPGDTQGEATDPLAIPKKKAEVAEPEFDTDPLFCINRGI